MINLAFGIQGQGGGHIEMARILTPELRARGVNLTCIFSGRDPDKFQNMKMFEPYKIYNGLRMVTKGGEVSYLKTAFNPKSIPFVKEVRALDISQFDALVTNFEPVLGQKAYWNNRNIVGISHQYSFRYDVPGSGLERKYLNAWVRGFAPVSIPLGTHWDSFDQPNILPPIVSSPERPKEIDPANVAVYMPWEDKTELIHFLQHFDKKYRFHVFSPQVSATYEEGNILLNPPSADGKFMETLRNSARLISNAGFETPAEAQALGLPMAIKPLIGQYEQHCNAEGLRTLGRAHVMHTLDVPTVKNMLAQESCLRVSWGDVAGPVAQWIVDGMRESALPSLTDTAWNNVKKQELAVPCLNFH